jgi:hypothetical protein
MNQPRPRTILFLAANPAGTTQLRLDEENREIDEGLRRARQRDRFELKQKWAVRPQDLQRAILDYDPQIIHFSGHGAGAQGIVLQGDDGSAKPVSAGALESLFALFPRVECVLLNACHSEVQAEAIAKHVQYVIGMHQDIGDDAAITFATAFYDALGAGRPIDFAFKSGRTAIQLAGIPEHLTPVLKVGRVSSVDGQERTPRPGRQAKRAPRRAPHPTEAFDKVKGTIEDPRSGQVVGPTFQCSGAVSGMDPTLSLWLVVEVGNLKWPKENKAVVDQENRWSATIFEDGAVNEFSVALFLGDSSVDKRILKWLERGRHTGTYSELKGIPGARRLDRVDRLRLERGASREKA